MSALLTAALLGFGVVFVAELGDKSQLMALTFATRYPAMPVLLGITLATAALMVVSVGVGAILGATIPARPLTLLGGLAFIGFGIWTLRDDRDDDGEEPDEPQARGVVVAVASAFFLAEFGDKTMFATVALATREGPVGIWLGATAGMVAADALAIVVGRALGTRLPERAVRIGAAVAFFAFGALLVLDALW